MDQQPRPGVRIGRLTLSRKQTVAVAAAVIVIALGATAIAMRLSAAANGDGATGPTGVAVTAASVVRRDLAVSTTVTGTLSPETSLDLNCKVAGVVAKVHVALGDAVTKGQALVSLSSSDLAPQARATEAALQAAKAALLQMQSGATWEELQQVQATLAQAQAGWEAAVAAFQRMQFLYGEGAISRQQYESSETQLKVSTAQLTAAQMQLAKATKGASEASLMAAQAQVTQAQAAYDAAAARLEDTILRAPAAGMVSYVAVSAGELVSPGIPQVGVVASGRVFLEAAVTENLLPSLTQGAQLAVLIPAYNVTRMATIDQIAPAADQRTRLFQVRIVIDNADGSLRGGLTAQAKVETSRVSGVIAVPREALVTSGTEHAVFVIADGIARRRVVQAGLLGETLAEITTGLAEGERVVVAGVDFLRDGTAVNVVRDVTP